MINTDKQKIEEILTRGVNEVIDLKNLREKLLSGRQLRIKLGIDPTSPNIHLGRAVTLLKMKDFQDLGHQIVFIIGDFTGQIGDTSDKESERPMLTQEAVKSNMKSYLDQAGKILDLTKIESYHNSEWLAKLGYAEIGEQADQFSLADFISRENIKKRLDAGTRVSLRELLYPLMQGYDSVEIKADVEIGGTDQRFNLLTGRTMQQHFSQKPQDVLMVNLIMGSDGRKMSSSWGNTINLSDSADDMYGKVMSVADDQIIPYFEHCTRVEMAEVKKYEELIKSGQNPRDLKMKLALAITEVYYSVEEAAKAEDRFKEIFQNRATPTEIEEVKLADKALIEILLETSLASSKTEVRRLIEQKGIKVDDEIVQDENLIVKSGSVIQKGKRHFIKVV